MWNTLRNASRGLRLRSEASKAFREIDRTIRNLARTRSLATESLGRSGSIDLGFGCPSFQQKWYCGGTTQLHFTALAEEWYGDNIICLSYNSDLEKFAWDKAPSARYVTRAPVSELNDLPIWESGQSEGFVDFVERYIVSVGRDLPSAPKPRLP